MAQTLNLDLSADGGDVVEHVGLARQTAADLGILAAVTEAPDPAFTGLTLTSGLWVSVARPVVSDVDPFVEDFGFERGAVVELTFNSASDADAQVAQGLQLTFGLLGRLPSDAVLHHEYFEVWLTRLRGELTLSDRDDIWYPDRLALVPGPYSRAPLAFTSM